jgi:HEAT repeat protein
MSLYQYEREGDAQALIGVLARSENEEVRARAAALLGELEDHEDRDDIVRALVRAAQEEEGNVVAAAVDALDTLGQDAIEALIASMADVDFGDGAEWVRAKAFTRALSADVPELRMAAANALGELGQRDTVRHLTDRFADSDPRVRARAARACGKIGDARATDALAGLLDDPKAAVRREAAESLGAIGNRQALQALLGLYDDDSEIVRRIAVMGFGSFENDRPVDHLVTALGDESPAVRRTAVYSLVALLSNVPSERSHEIREAVLERLSASDDETVVGPLVDIMTESTQNAQRRNTAWLLGRAVDPEDPGTRRQVVDALVGALRIEDRMTRQFAATSLAELGEDYAEAELLGVATDDAADSETRGQAIFTLGKIGGQEAREDLERLLEETDDETIRQQAFTAISKLGGGAGVGS